MLVVPIISKQEARGGSNKSQLRLILMSFCLHLAQGKGTHWVLEVQSWVTQIKGTGVPIKCEAPWWCLSVIENLGSFRYEKTLEIPESSHKLNTANPTTKKASLRVTSSLLSTSRDKSKKELWRDEGWISENTWDCFRGHSFFEALYLSLSGYLICEE